ncbi:hypothetical protein MBLNU457_7207t1 [Dothideomycetes sp. NU457]
MSDKNATTAKIDENDTNVPAVEKEDKSKDATDVAGRENKGLAGAGMLGKVSEMTDKITPNNKTGGAAKSEGWMNDPQ